MNRTRDWRFKQEKPPSRGPAARCERLLRRSAFDGVAALSVFVLRERHGQSHLLADGPRQKAAHRVRLPPVAFISSLAVTPPGRLSRSRTLLVLLPSRADLAFFAPLGFLGRARLLSRLTLLGRNVGATFGLTGGFSSFWLPSYGVGGRFGLFCIRDHVFSLCGNHRAVTTWITPVRTKRKANLHTASEAMEGRRDD
jgi:hypothetical protein